eukprot:900982-Prorocentrum_minimum.AAC.1
MVRYLRKTWPFWDRAGGLDHIFVMMGDHGACESPRGMGGGVPPVLAPAILLSHWGNTFDVPGAETVSTPDPPPTLRCWRPR